MHCDHALGGWDSRRLFWQGWSCALWVATLLEELVCLPSWKGRAGSQVPSGSLRLSGSAYFASAWSQPQPGLCPPVCNRGENRGWGCRQRNRGGTRIHLCHFFSGLLWLFFKTSCITLGGKKVKLLCFFLCKAALVNNASMLCRAVRQRLEYLWSLQKYWALWTTWEQSVYSQREDKCSAGIRKVTSWI